MNAALHQILIIFTAIAAGFVCRKLDVLTEDGTQTLSGIVIKVILPFYLFNAIVSSKAGVDAGGVAEAIMLSAGMFLLSGIVALITVPLMKPKAGDKGVLMFEIMCGNVTYIGIPVCQAVFGEKAAFYASLLNIPYNLLCFSLGIFLLAGKMSLKKILNPAFLSGVLAAALYAAKVHVPEIITDGCAFIGQATSPCAMLVIGSVLGGVPFKEIFREWRAIPYTLLRLFGIAALTAFLLSYIKADSVLKGVLVLMAAMPAATNSTMLCTIYGGNRELSAKLIFISTALSAVTIPLWSAFFMKG